MLRTADERHVQTALRIANCFGVTQLVIATPQDGKPNAMTIEGETWIDRRDGMRRSVSATRSTEIVGDAEVLPVLDAAAGYFAAYVTHGVPRGYAMYLAIRDAVYDAQRAAGVIPADAG